MTDHPTPHRSGREAGDDPGLAVRRFEAALAAAPIVVAEVDTELRYSWVHNPHPDFDPGAVIGKRDDEIDSGPGIDELVRLKAQVLATGEGIRAEIAFDRTNGRRWYDVSIEPLRAGDDRLLGLTTAALDITDRKKAEEALRWSQELLVETGRMARVGGWEIDLDTEQVYWTVTTREIHEVEDDYEPFLEEALAFFPGRAAARLAHAVQEAREQGRPYDLELPFVTARGRELQVRTIGRPEFEDGVCVRLTGTFHDITARKEQEAALRKQKAMLARTEEIARIGSWDWNLASGEITWSDGVFRIFGLDPAEPTPDWSGHRKLMDDDSMARLDAAVRECTAEGTPFAVEIRSTRSDGGAGICITRGRREYRDDGVHLVGFVEDVTEEKQLEEERRRLQQQFEQSQRLESVGRLAGGIAHDFNNILTAITGHAAAIQEADGIPDALGAEAGLIVEAADRAASLTRQLLAFGRKQLVQKQHVSLGGTVQGMAQMLQRLLPETIRLEVTAPAEGTTVYADPGQLEQVALNLVVNAADAIEGHGSIHMQVDPPVETDPAPTGGAEDARSYVRLTVRDDGKGMPPEIQTRIFEPFFTTKPDSSGTGLGLATVYGIVQQADGRIEVDSEPGAGTSFRVYLPAAGALAEVAQPSSRRESRATGLRDGGGRVLIVEDDPAVRRVVRRTLTRAGLEILEAEDGRAALDLIQQSDREIDLVITDVVMPRMSGVELLQRLQQEQPDLPVILTSGYSEEELPTTLDTLTLLLPKPFTPAELRERVENALGL